MASTSDVNLEQNEDSTYRDRLAIDQFTTFSTAIIKSIATFEGTPPTEVELHLYDHIAPEALNAMYKHAQDRQDAIWELNFTTSEYDVTVQSDGHIEIT